jgi:hypothetical protein
MSKLLDSYQVMLTNGHCAVIFGACEALEGIVTNIYHIISQQLIQGRCNDMYEYNKKSVKSHS